MSMALVKEQIKKFLKSENPEVLAIKGRWGVGKTYHWEHSLKTLKDEMALNSYSYVSLFGLNSLDELKKAVFENKMLKDEIGNKPTVKQYAKKLTGMLEDVNIPVISNYIDGLGSVFNSVSYLSLNKMIICFDDLERRSEGLSIKDFLGIVSFFKEQKDCKIVILLNEDASGLEDYFIYKEKVIDKQLHFEPTSKECFDAAFEDNDKEVREHIYDLCMRLDIKNIRVLRKIAQHIREILPLVDTYHTEVRREVIHSMVISSWCYYCHSSNVDDIPHFDFAMNKKKSNTFVLNLICNGDEEKVKAKEAEWEEILFNHGYTIHNALNNVIAEGVEQGFIDKARFEPLCVAKDKEYKVREENHLLSFAWDLYHGSFDKNQDQVLFAMEEGLRDAVKNISASQFSDGIKVIRTLSGDSKANSLIDLFILTHQYDPENLNVNNLRTNSFSVEDEIFNKKLQEAYTRKRVDKKPIDVLRSRKGGNTFNDSDVNVLAKLSVDELKYLFKTFNGSEQTPLIQTCLMLARSNTQLMKNTKQALTDIGKESSLNSCRVAKFNL
ncbi:hypothetical protein GNP79_13860 [Aliivibrio fischeri]|uniref:KAP NTPase domain-containing protein n=1 Tax=Aliivibrio fischeri TaxID=668 RepID=A0A6N3Z8M7_ALIFS|nr:hypothetical protein [Aliivibrio fischeri]MUK46405.1 hypothetical protein [Aliivibrio fischeri]MUK81882.1 hypothetical protein [Aliivibrio fischeri]MUK85064.1 hypothetical protein [Aliivibrio fischeri]